MHISFNNELGLMSTKGLSSTVIKSLWKYWLVMTGVISVGVLIDVNIPRSQDSAL